MLKVIEPELNSKHLLVNKSLAQQWLFIDVEADFQFSALKAGLSAFIGYECGLGHDKQNKPATQHVNNLALNIFI